jgi:hypothetical protein
MPSENGSTPSTAGRDAETADRAEGIGAAGCVRLGDLDEASELVTETAVCLGFASPARPDGISRC